MSKVEDRVKDLIEKPIADIGYELYDIEYIKDGLSYILRIYIDVTDKEKGVDLEDCEKVSNLIDPLLDEEDIISEQYYLEVSSPGIERVLKTDKHLTDNKNKMVQLKLYKQINGTKNIIGKLIDFSEDKVIVKNEEDNTTNEIERKDISKIQIYYEGI